MKVMIIFLFLVFSLNCFVLEYENVCPYSRNPVSLTATVKDDIDLLETYNTIAVVNLNCELVPKIEKQFKEKIENDLVNSYELNLRNIGFNVVERRSLEAIFEEQALSLTGFISDKDAIKIGEILAAKAIAQIDVYICSYENENQLYTQSIKIIDVETGEILANGASVNVVAGTTYMINLIYEQNLLNRIMRNNIIGTNYYEASNPDSALKYYKLMQNDLLLINELEKNNILDENVKELSTIYHAIVFNNLGACYKDKENWFQAVNYLDRSINFQKENKIDNPSLLSRVYFHLCDLNIKNKDYKKAIEYGKEGQKICIEHQLVQQECKIIKLLKESYFNLNKEKQLNKLIKRENEIFCS